jgi:arginyl-tRNA synthetase
MQISEKINQEISQLFKKIDLLKDENIEQTIETPPQPEFGDLASNICFSLSKKLGKSPKQISEEIASSLKLPRESIFSRVEAKAGYINFFFDYSKLSELILKEIMTEKENFGKSTIGRGKRVMIEYSQPNPVHPMHIGHSRSTFLGDSLAKILDFLGYKTIRANYMNDTGLQVAKLVTAYLLWARGKKPEGKPDMWLWKYYVKFHEEAKKNSAIEDKARDTLRKFEIEHEKETLKVWNRVVRWCIKGFEETYEKLRVKFDVYLFENEYRDQGKKIVQEAIKKGIAFKSEEGAIVAHLEKYGLPGCVILRSDETGLYVTSDLGMTPYKFKRYRLDESIWVVASAQDLYFKQLFKILELLGYSWVKNCHHFSFDLVHLPEGKMSSREGRAVMIDEVLKKLTKKVLEEVEKKNPKLSKKEKLDIAEKVAVGAFKYNILKVEPHKTITFDWERMLSLEGDTGPYLQYAHVRASKILMKAGKWKENYSVKELKEQEKNLVKKLIQFPTIVEQSARDMRPHYICNYAHELSEIFSDFYHSCPVIHAETEELRNFRLTLVKATQITLKNCLNLLGIEAPEKM